MGEILAKFWAPIWAVCTTVALVVMALLSKTYAKQESLTQLKREVDRIESRLEELPTRTELHKLNLEIANLRGDIKALSPQLARMQYMSDLLLENELKEKA